MGSSLKALRKFPAQVQDYMGYRHQDAKVLSGFGGAGVMEVIKDHRENTFRAVYTVKYLETVLSFTPSGKIEERAANATPGHRVNQATIARGRSGCEGEKAMKKRRFETGSGNVFRGIGVPNAEEHLIKAQLVFKIDAILKKRGLKQVEAAELFSVRQPDVSKMLRGEFRQFSVERLLRFLVALDHDVEIVVKPHRNRNQEAAMQVV